MASEIRRRIIAGLLLVLPFLVTFWVLYWLYSLVENYVINPIARRIVYFMEGTPVERELEPWFANYIAPILGIVGVVLLLYLLGFLAQSRLVKLLDKLLLRVPIVTMVHRGVSKFFQALAGQGEFARFQRVVLVAFPHPGMRVPGFVTSSCRDAETKKVILCVYVPTTPIPSSGYMLLIPEENVTDIDWDLEEALQAVISFGITVPEEVRYFHTRPEQEPE